MWLCRYGRWICHCADRYTLESSSVAMWNDCRWTNAHFERCVDDFHAPFVQCAMFGMATSSSDSGALRSQHTRRVQCVQVQNWQWVRAKAKWLHVISIKWELTYGMHFQEENNNWIHMRSYIHIAFRNIFTIFSFDGAVDCRSAAIATVSILLFRMRRHVFDLSGAWDVPTPKRMNEVRYLLHARDEFPLKMLCVLLFAGVYNEQITFGS